MSFGSFIKSVGRAIDPTSSKAPLGSLVRTAINVVPGGSAVLGGVQVAGSALSAAKSSGTPVQPSVAPVAPPMNVSQAQPSLMQRAQAFLTKPAGIAAGLAAVAGLVWLLVKRRK